MNAKPEPPCPHERTQTLIIEALVNGTFVPSRIYTRCRRCRSTLSVTERASALMLGGNIPARAGEWKDDA